jgi:hypothetical protein
LSFQNNDRFEMMFALKIASIVLGVCLLLGCEPGFIVDNTQEVVKTLGFDDSFDIKRNHNLVFSTSSQFSVAAMADQKSTHQSLLGCAELAFSRYFTTTTISDATQLNHALQLAQSNGANFLAMVSVIDTERVKVEAGQPSESYFGTLLAMISGKAEDEDVAGQPSESYLSADLVIDIYDVNSQILADKITFTARKGGDSSPLREILELPMLAVVKELVGDS